MNALAASFPWASADDLSRIELVPEASRPHRLVLRLVLWGRDVAGLRYIRDVKEQECAIPALDDSTRWCEFVAALRVVACEVLSSPRVESMMPQDFLIFSPLKLRASTQVEFETALRVKSRLGRWL